MRCRSCAVPVGLVLIQLRCAAALGPRFLDRLHQISEAIVAGALRIFCAQRPAQRRPRHAMIRIRILGRYVGPPLPDDDRRHVLCCARC